VLKQQTGQVIPAFLGFPSHPLNALIHTQTARRSRSWPCLPKESSQLSFHLPRIKRRSHVSPDRVMHVRTALSFPPSLCGVVIFSSISLQPPIYFLFFYSFFFPFFAFPIQCYDKRDLHTTQPIRPRNSLLEYKRGTGRLLHDDNDRQWWSRRPTHNP